MKNQTNKTEFWANLGYGLAWFLFCVGIGGCNYLVNKKDCLSCNCAVIEKANK